MLSGQLECMLRNLLANSVSDMQADLYTIMRCMHEGLHVHMADAQDSLQVECQKLIIEGAMAA